LIAPGQLDPDGWVRDAAIAPDVLSVRASITGIHAAITAAASDIVAIAWDMPFVPSALVATLIQRLGDRVPAVVPVVDGMPEPLCAAYSRSVADPIAEAVDAGIYRNSDVLERLPGVVWLEESELRRFGDPRLMFFNVNTPTDLIEAEEIARGM
jgi:molybdopterin-guanine dinucleotide biosynthesis protein A